MLKSFKQGIGITGFTFLLNRVDSSVREWFGRLQGHMWGDALEATPYHPLLARHIFLLQADEKQRKSIQREIQRLSICHLQWELLTSSYQGEITMFLLHNPASKCWFCTLLELLLPVEGQTLMNPTFQSMIVTKHPRKTWETRLFSPSIPFLQLDQKKIKIVIFPSRITYVFPSLNRMLFRTLCSIISYLFLFLMCFYSVDIFPIVICCLIVNWA